MPLYRVTVEYSMPNASQVLNVFHFDTGGEEPSNNDIMDDFEDWVTNVWGSDWADLASSDLDLIGYSVSRMNLNGTVAENVGDRTVAVPGENLGDYAVQAASGYISADTDFPKIQGSKYIPGLSEGDILDGILVAEAIADLVLLAIDLVQTFNGTGSAILWQPGVLSTSLASFVPFNGGSGVTDIPAYQRRRKPNVGS